MSSSPTLILNPTRGVEEEEMLDQGRRHTPPPGSRPNSRLEILMVDMIGSQAELARSQGDMARSQEDMIRSQAQLARSQGDMARSQEDLVRSQEERFESFARAQSEQLANMMGRL